jgi:hypothetical protein
MKIRPLDILFGLKAINLSPDLKNNDRPVAAALLDHYNRQTGQCDPSLERIAQLLGISTRTVMRSIARIVAAGLFTKDRHGGHLNRNSYQPNWNTFRNAEAVWSARTKAKSESKRLTGMSPASGQPCHVDGDKPVTQTCPSNLSKGTCQKRQPKKEADRGKSDDAAHTAAERRWTTQLHEQFSSLPLTYGEIIQAIDDEIRAAATEAELRNRGAGFAYIVNKLRLRGRW